MKNLVYEVGDRLSFLASLLVHPDHASGDTYTNLVAPGQGISTPVDLVEDGDPVVCGRIVGVAENDALQSTDLIVVRLKGVFSLAVQCLHHSITVGETIYINPSTGVLSDDITQVPFGSALGTVPSGTTASIPVRLFGATPGAIGADS
jgi:predicted RecA/RadA family phage recombinase